MSCYLNMMQLTYTGNIWHSVSRRVSGSGGSGRGSGGNSSGGRIGIGSVIMVSGFILL